MENGPSFGMRRSKSERWPVIYRPETDVATLTDADTTEISQKGRIPTNAARVARTDAGTLKIAENGECEPADDDRPLEMQAVSGDETIVGGESSCQSELGFFFPKYASFLRERYPINQRNDNEKLRNENARHQKHIPHIVCY